MYEVHLHGKTVSVDRMLAGTMEVELQEREVPAFQVDRTPLGHVDLDGVPHVRHVRLRGVPLDVQGSRARRDRARQIYRRLLRTFGTNRVDSAARCGVGASPRQHPQRTLKSNSAIVEIIRATLDVE